MICNLSLFCQKITILRILAKGHIPRSRSRGVQNSANLLLIAKSTLASSTTLSTHTYVFHCRLYHSRGAQAFFQAGHCTTFEQNVNIAFISFLLMPSPFMPQIHFGIIKSICCSYRLQLRAYFSGRTLIRTL